MEDDSLQRLISELRIAADAQLHIWQLFSVIHMQDPLPDPRGKTSAQCIAELGRTSCIMLRPLTKSALEFYASASNEPALTNTHVIPRGPSATEFVLSFTSGFVASASKAIGINLLREELTENEIRTIEKKLPVLLQAIRSIKVGMLAYDQCSLLRSEIVGEEIGAKARANVARIDAAYSAAAELGFCALSVLEKARQPDVPAELPDGRKVPNGSQELAFLARNVDIEEGRVTYAQRILDVADTVLAANLSSGNFRLGEVVETTAHKAVLRFAHQIANVAWLHRTRTGFPQPRCDDPDWATTWTSAVWPELRETFASYPLFDWNTVRVALEREHAAALAGQPAGKLRPATASQNQENDTATSAQHRSASPAQAAHNADFTMVNWFGVEYQFALGIQALAVRALWEEWERTGLGLHQDTIREAIDPERDKFRMDNAFRNHRAFGTMITSCGDGRYKLTPPQTEPAAVKNRNRKNRTKTPKSRQKRV